MQTGSIRAVTTLAIECCNPVDHAEEIKDLFARNGEPGFDSVFERAYRRRAESGLKSWIARADGRAVMHISVNPTRFVAGDASVVGGVLGDLMVDEAHRDFWAPVRLVRTMVSDLRRDAHIRFLFTTATQEAGTVFKAGGFKPFGAIRRFVSPTYLPYTLLSRIRAGVLGRARRNFPLNDSEITALLPGLRSGTYWRPSTDGGYFATRIPRFGFADGTWVTTGSRKLGTVGWSLVSRHGTLSEATLADAFWTDRGKGLPEAAIAAAVQARRDGFSSISVTVLEGARTARELKRAGFIPRPPLGELLLNPLHEAPPSLDDWFLTGFFLSSW